MCAWCQAVVPERPTGRPGRFCSGRCRVAAHRAGKMLPGVPAEMVGRRRWVRRVGKRPVTVRGASASSTRPDTWGSLREALASPIGDGIGFMLGGGVGCLDLDHCVSSSGAVSPLAEGVLAEAGATYVEVSPSGTGLHVFGLLPEGPGRRLPGVEVYSRARFMTVTGVPFRGAPAALGDLTAVASSLLV